MQISVWYPAVKTARQSFMRFEEYVYLLSQELNFSPLTTKQARQSVDTFMKGPVTRGAAIDKLDALMKMRTGAIKNASPAPGRFPLVVYAHIPPSGNSIMCE
jgi:hypothetical protein